MNSRWTLLIAAVLSLPLVTSQVSQTPAEPYVVSAFNASTAHGSPAADSRPARYSVSVVDYAWFDSGRGRTIPARVYYPDDNSERFPVIIFSTGLGRSKDDCSYLGRHWASCGYVAVHVQHKGSDNDAQRGLRPKKELQQAFYDPSNIRNRPMDVIFVINQLDQLSHDGSPVGGRLDLDRIGVSGHDFGAQTAMALAGQVLPGQIAFAEHRVKAVVAMSAPVPLGTSPLAVGLRRHFTALFVHHGHGRQQHRCHDHRAAAPAAVRLFGRGRSISGHLLRRRSFDVLGRRPRCGVSAADRRVFDGLLGRLFEGRRSGEGVAGRGGNQDPSRIDRLGRKEAPRRRQAGSNGQIRRLTTRSLGLRSLCAASG